MANTMGADFDQIELGECSQLGLRERAQTFAQFRDHTGPFRKGVQGGKRQSFKSFRELVSPLFPRAKMQEHLRLSRATGRLPLRAICDYRASRIFSDT